jgi:hypothetical protein
MYRNIQMMVRGSDAADRFIGRPLDRSVTSIANESVDATTRTLGRAGPVARMQ